MFGFLKTQLRKAYDAFAGVRSFFSRTQLDEQAFQELEKLLIMTDMGVKVSRQIVAELKAAATKPATPLQPLLIESLEKLLIRHQPTQAKIFLLVGVNGSGKTTIAGKLAHLYKRPLLAAADTFRAAAPEQLQTWASKTSAQIVRGTPGQDPASVVHQACELFKSGSYDCLIIDTAGRLQTKAPLMQELEKIRRIITKQLPQETVETLLVIDATLGQNSLDQAQIFNQATPLNGIILTKLDGTSKGGAVFAISESLKLPIAYCSYGEQLEQFAPFEPKKFVEGLFSEK
jgi:fused signal recognition particle receptor